MTVQLVTRVPDSLAEAVDGLVEAGVFASRSDAVRAGFEVVVVDRERRDAIRRAIADGYRRVPQGEDDLAWSDEAMIAEEP
jgi:Arc/MetJ-type ribon-helix-helix transcriptional regulator